MGQRMRSEARKAGLHSDYERTFSCWTGEVLSRSEIRAILQGIFGNVATGSKERCSSRPNCLCGMAVPPARSGVRWMKPTRV